MHGVWPPPVPLGGATSIYCMKTSLSGCAHVWLQLQTLKKKKKKNTWFPRWHSGKESACQYRRHGFNLWVKKIPWRRKWQPLQYSCLENPMDRGAWWAADHGVVKSRTRLSDFTFTFPLHALEKEMATHSSILAWRIPGTEEPSGLLSMRSHRVGHD